MTAQYTNTSGIPLSIAVFLATDNYDYNDDPKTISATTLIKPLRQIILGTRVPESHLVSDLGSMMASRMGTAIHEGIEKAWHNNHEGAMKALGYPAHISSRVRINPDRSTLKTLADNGYEIIPVYMEQRLTKQVSGWTVSGKFDFVGQGRLEDFKTTGAYSVTTGINEPKFAMQGSIYRWMDPELITEDHMAIQYIITDWSSMQARQDANYPQQRFVQRLLDLKSVEDTDRYVRNKLALLDFYMDADETEVPLCTDEELQRTKPVYKYYKGGDTNASRSTKNFEDKQAAYIYMNDAGKGQGVVKEVPGQVTACRFCKAFTVCTQKDELLKTGEFSL